MKTIAEAMTKETQLYVHPQDVHLISYNPQMRIFAAQNGDVTIICWEKLDATHVVKKVIW